MIYFESTNTNYYREPGQRHFGQAVFVDTLDRKQVIVGWVYKPTNEALSQYTVLIYRCLDQQENPGELIGEISAESTYFVDKAPNLFNTYQQVWYRLQIKEGGTITQAYTWHKQPMPTTLAYRRRIITKLKFGGVPTLIYQRKLDGSVCPDCYDDILEQSTNSACATCFGTGKIGGWYDPVYTLVNLIPPIKSAQPGKVYKQDQKTQALMGHYPVVLQRDILFDVNSGLRWRVEQVTPGRDTGDLISQQLILVKLSPQDIENDLPIPANLTLLIKPRRSRFDINLNIFKEIQDE